MTIHVHMAMGTQGDNKLEDIIRDLKSYTSRHILCGLSETLRPEGGLNFQIVYLNLLFFFIIFNLLHLLSLIATFFFMPYQNLH